MQRVYDWNYQFRTQNHGAPLTAPRLHALVRKIAKHFRIPKPKLATKYLPPDYLGYTTRDFGAKRSTIVFNRRELSWTPNVVAHEMAHVIQQHYGLYPRQQHHGRVFVGIMTYIMHKFGIMPAQAALPSLSFGKVKYVMPGKATPAHVRAMAKRRKK